jgi:hypothetical protein
VIAIEGHVLGPCGVHNDEDDVGQFGFHFRPPAIGNAS